MEQFFFENAHLLLVLLLLMIGAQLSIIDPRLGQIVHKCFHFFIATKLIEKRLWTVFFNLSCGSWLFFLLYWRGCRRQVFLLDARCGIWRVRIIIKSLDGSVKKAQRAFFTRRGLLLFFYRLDMVRCVLCHLVLS